MKCQGIKSDAINCCVTEIMIEHLCCIINHSHFSVSAIVEVPELRGHPQTLHLPHAAALHTVQGGL